MRRHPDNPILTRADLPDIAPSLRDPTSVFNPGALRVGDRDSLLLRVQTRGRESLLLVADEQADGSFRAREELFEIEGLDAIEETVHHVYDPRLTRLEGRVLLCCAVDTDTRCALLVAETDDRLQSARLLSFDPEGDRRNGVIFPKRIDGRYLRLERPNAPPTEPGEPPSGDRVVLSESPDLVEWRVRAEVFEGRLRTWDERIGSGPPPVLTTEGWLLVYHGVATHFGTSNIYQAGVVLLDAEDPGKVLARSRRNILEPRELYELVGQVGNVVFPSGITVEGACSDEPAPPEASVRIYYGAADSCVGLVETSVGELVEAARLD
ncbi:MAG: hypothetical protein AAF533_13250 [Acidobacteriota bacterium]